MSIVVGVTGASGAVISQRLLERLEGDKALVVSENGERIVAHELGEGGMDRLASLATWVHRNDDLGAPIASGSHPFDGMVIVPCSMSTMSKIAGGIGDNLITRAASVCLKERRTLVLAVRETPLSPIHLENMTRLAHAGAVIMPLVLTFYNRPSSLDDVVNTTVSRLLDALGRPNELAPRWKGMEEGH